MKKTLTKRTLKYLIVLGLVLLSVLTASFVFAEDAPASEPVTILAGSDFQAEAGNSAGRAQIAAILAAMEKDGITSADGLLFCGDYDYEFEDTRSGVNSVKQAVSGMVKENLVFVQGNHDKAVNTDGLSPSGNNDPASGKYGVFVINEDDYMWYNEREATIKRTAQLLTEYLNEKIASGYDKPIFVLSHLPLHYNMRTMNEGDNMHARYLVNVLNEAGKKGLNIFFLFGHDHSNGWDDYLGGSSIYLKKGDSILVCTGRQAMFKETEIHFTYMNAGYTGYYRNENGADDALTMSYITITDDDVTIVRYDKNGIHNLKSEGVRNSFKNETRYQPNKTVYPSPQTVTLTSLTDTAPIADLLPSDTTLGRYQKVHSATDLKDGGKYLIVYNSSTDRIMLPQVVTKADTEGEERIGFEIEICPDFGGEVVYGNYIGKEWTFRESDNGWLIGTNEGDIAFSRTTVYAVTATLESEGGVFKIEGDRDAFVLRSGSYRFNYNARMLFNGYTSDPAHFYLYEFVGYDLAIEGGTSDKAESVFDGQTVTVTAKAPEEGFVFDAWLVERGELSLEDATKESISFVMPAEAVSLRATYKEKQVPITTTVVTTAENTPISTPATTVDRIPVTTPETTTISAPESSPVTTTESTPETTPENNNDSEKKDGGTSMIVWVAIGSAALLLGGGAAVLVVVKKKKK